MINNTDWIKMFSEIEGSKLEIKIEIKTTVSNSTELFYLLQDYMRFSDTSITINANNSELNCDSVYAQITKNNDKNEVWRSDSSWSPEKSGLDNEETTAIINEKFREYLSDYLLSLGV